MRALFSACPMRLCNRLLPLGRASLVVALSIFCTRSEAGTFGDPSVSPDNTIQITSSNMQGWQEFGYLNFNPDNTNPGVLGAFSDLTGDYVTGYWQHRAVYGGGNNNFFEFAYDGSAVQGKLVSDWHGFEYRNYQMTPGSTRHAVVLFEIDPDGNLGTTGDSVYLRFQPGFMANFATPLAEWNTYGVQGQNTNFMDAVNASNTSSQSYQSINDLFLAPGSKSNTGSGGSPLQIPSTSIFRSVILAGGFQGFPEIDELVDYMQLTFDTDPGAGLTLETTRFDFGEVQVLVQPVPEPGSFSLLGVGLLALLIKRKKRIATSACVCS